MPPPRTGEAAHRHRMIRRILAVRGQVRFGVGVAPRFDYARARHEVALTRHGALFRSPELGLSLSATSLPEELGGARNWDYRYTWMRDAAFTLYALLRLGFTEEAGAFLGWLEGRFRHAGDRESGPLQTMYGIDGREDLREQELSHLEGYMGSATVRIGNRAATQLQLDIYGELMDSVYLCNKYGLPSTTTAGWS